MHAVVLAVIFCDFISPLIGRETINIPEIFSGVHGFTGMTVNNYICINYIASMPGEKTSFTHKVSLSNQDCQTVNMSDQTKKMLTDT